MTWIDEYLAHVGAALPGPARAHAAILAELRSGLLDAAEAYRRAGFTPAAARRAGADEFGDPIELAAGFRSELATARARQLAVVLLVSAPLIAFAWTAAAFASHLGAHHAYPWQWNAASPGWHVALPLAAAAVVVGICTAATAVAASGRLTRWLPECTRFASVSAITSAVAAGVVDLILLLLLVHQFARAPATLDATPVTIAAVASITRFAFTQRSIRCTPSP